MLELKTLTLCVAELKKQVDPPKLRESGDPPATTLLVRRPSVKATYQLR
jgi:hypothetical protein